MLADLNFIDRRGPGARIALALCLAAASQALAHELSLDAPGRGGGTILLVSLVVASRLAGVLPALVTLATHMIVVAWAWLEPFGSIVIARHVDRVWLLIFAAFGLGLVAIAAPRCDTRAAVLARYPRRWSRASVAVALSLRGRRSEGAWIRLLDEVEVAIEEATRPE